MTPEEQRRADLQRLVAGGIDAPQIGPISIETPDEEKRRRDFQAMDASRLSGVATAPEMGFAARAFSPGVSAVQLQPARGLKPVEYSTQSAPDEPMAPMSPQVQPPVSRYGVSVVPSMKKLFDAQQKVADIEKKKAGIQARSDQAAAELFQAFGMDHGDQALQDQRETDAVRRQIESQMAKYKGALDSVPDRVDDRRWFRDRSGMGQVFAGLGVIMGAVGQAINPKHQNAALQLINSYIDRDIQMQQYEMENKRRKAAGQENVLEHLYRKLGDKQAAQDILRMRQIEGFKRGLETIKAGNLADQSKMAADELQAQLNLQQQDIMQRRAEAAARAVYVAQQKAAEGGPRPLASNKTLQAKEADEDADYYNADTELMSLVRLRKGTSAAAPEFASSTKTAYNATLQNAALAQYKLKTGAAPNQESEAKRAIAAWDLGFKPMGSQLQWFESKRKENDAARLRRLVAKQKAGVDVSEQLRSFEEYRKTRPSLKDLPPMVIGEGQ